MDIGLIQQQWQQELDQTLSGKAAAASQNDTHATTLAGIENKIKQARGLSRLKNPFIKAAKIAPLHHKQKKLAKSIAKGQKRLGAIAQDTVFSLAAAVVKGTAQEANYKRLNGAFKQLDNAKALIKTAAGACNTASGRQHWAACKNIDVSGADNDTKEAITAIKTAAQALKSLQQQTNRQVPQIDGALADSLAKGMIEPPYTWSNFGSPSYRWDLVDRLAAAETQLHNIGDSLGSVKNILKNDCV